MYADIFFGFEHVDMPVVRHIDEVEYVHKLCNYLQKRTDIDTLDLACFFFGQAVWQLISGA